jgi:hypothetical protein
MGTNPMEYNVAFLSKPIETGNESENERGMKKGKGRPLWKDGL